MSVLFLDGCGYIGIDWGDGAAVDGVDGLAGQGPAAGGGSDASGGSGLGTGAAPGSGGDGAGGDLATGGATSVGGGAGGDGGSDGGSGGTSQAGGEPGAGGSADGGQTGSGGVASGGSASGGSDSGGASAGGTAGVGGISGGAGGAAGGGTAAGGTGGGTCDLADPACALLSEEMVNRFSFDGVGTELVDSLGGESGTVRWTTLDGSGKVSLSGSNQFVELPGGLISSLPNASFEVWFVWRGGLPWQRLFDFGSQDFLGDPVNYLYLTPRVDGAFPAEDFMGCGLRHLNGGEVQLRNDELTAQNVLTHVVLIADDTANRLVLYKNGAWVAERDTDVRLDAIRDDIGRIGRSLFVDDAYFNGEIEEFRIYAEVLTPEAVSLSYQLGPDATLP